MSRALSYLIGHRGEAVSYEYIGTGTKKRCHDKLQYARKRESREGKDVQGKGGSKARPSHNGYFFFLMYGSIFQFDMPFFDL